MYWRRLAAAVWAGSPVETQLVAQANGFLKRPGFTRFRVKLVLVESQTHSVATSVASLPRWMDGGRMPPLLY